MIRLYFCFLSCLVAGMGTVVITDAIAGQFSIGPLLADIVFLVGSAICIWRLSAAILLSATAVIGAVTAFIATGIFLAYLGGQIYSSAPPVGDFLSRAFSVGLYPDGADVPFEFGAPIWAFSMIALCAVSLALGALLKWLRPHTTA